MSEITLFNLAGLALAFVSLILYAMQRYRDRKQDQTLSTLLEAVKKAGPLPPDAVETLITEALERQRETRDQKEFEAAKSWAVKAYSEALSKDGLIESLLKEKSAWVQKMEAKDTEITKLVRKVNTLQADIQALQHTIARLSGAEDSGPLDKGDE